MMNKVLHSVTLTTIVILVILLAIKTKQLNVVQDKNLASASSIAKLEKELGFNKNTIAALQLENGRLIILTKDKNGNVVPQHPYVPPEGGARIRIDQASSTSGVESQPTIHIDVKNKGFTFKPGIGVVWSGKLYPELNFKLAYWDRYSGNAGLTEKFVDLTASRHLDDLIPFITPQNIEVKTGIGINYMDMVKRFVFGMGANF